jgi:NAD(P)-dependent dehydrogenase (short-subunit alcohol dehydrogenase family)
MYLEKFRLGGRVAVVTGAGQGIGLACAEALAEAGAKVIIADRDPKAAEAGCASLKAKGYDAEVVIMDVTDSARVAEVADQLASQHGKIDILVNNAGIARSETPAEKVTDEHWLNVVDVNLNGTFWCCRAFGKHMLEARSGAIVNIGSMSGFIVNKPQEQCTISPGRWQPSGAPAACASMPWRQPISPPPSMRSSRTTRGCMMPGSAVRRWPGWGRSTKLRPSSCFSHPMPQA